MNTPRPKASPLASNDSNPASRSDRAFGKGAFGVTARTSRAEIRRADPDLPIWRQSRRTPAVLDQGGDVVGLPPILSHLPVGVARGLGDRQRCPAALGEVQQERHILGALHGAEPTGVVGVDEDVDAVAQTR